MRRVKLNPYGKLCTQFYDLTKPGPPENAFNFYLQQAKIARGPVLEPMCGSGRFLIPLLKQGIDIDGTDASADMLEACHTKCDSLGLKTNLYQQLIQETSLPRKYKLIIIPARSFILVIDEQEARTSLRKMYQHLVPGGKLILEIDTPNAAGGQPGQWMGRWVDRPDGARIMFSVLASYDRKKKIESAVHKYELFLDGRLKDTELEHFATRFYERDEFTSMLSEAKFKNIKASKVYDDAEPGENDQSILFSAES
jgi:SAM-dependent methyltransferase